MALIALRPLLDHAAEHGYGVPAFNVNNMEQIQAILQAAHACDAPVILQASAGARKYAGEPFLRKLVEAAIEQYPQIPICLHQDHGASPAVCQQAIRSGFSSVMMDGSLLEDEKTPASYDYNVAVTRRVVEMAHAVGVSVEGELGCLGSLETGNAGEEDGVGADGTLDHTQLLTDPEQAADFVARTGVDALAIAIGTSHGAYKFSRQPTGDILAIDRIAAIHQRDPRHPPGDARQLQRAAGMAGRDPPVRRRHPRNLRRAGRRDRARHPPRRAQDQHRHRHPAGDDRRHAQGHGEQPGEFDPRAFLKAATAAARDICRARFEAFGCAGWGSDIQLGRRKLLVA